MHGVNRTVVASVLDWLEQGAQVWFVTVLSTWGASPRPPGSLFAYNAQTRKAVGSLSNGCIESDLIEQLNAAPADMPGDMGGDLAAAKRTYGGSSDEQTRFRLPCGGQLEILIERLTPDPETKQHFQVLNATLLARRQVARVRNLRSNRMALEAPERFAKTDFGSGHTLVHVLGPQARLLILGWGDPAEYLVPIARSLDFDVTICEPRADVLARANIPEGLSIRDDILPDDLIRASFCDADCAIIALAHDPRVDDLGLLAAFDVPAFYIGALGSVRTAAGRQRRFGELGIPDDALARLHAPAGIDIQSKTPPEIAVSIAAELLKARKQHLDENKCGLC